MKIKKGDTIKMLAGKDSGKTGKVLHSYPREGKIVVEGLNMLKKHMKPKREKEQGQRIEMPRKVQVSDAILICPKCGKGTRVGYKVSQDKKFRVCKKCGAEV